MDADLDLTDLRLFLHIAEAGSITAGAKASYLSLAAASARVLAMERALDLTLLARNRRGVQLTAEGTVLAARARAVLQQAARLRVELERHVQGQRVDIALVGTSAALREFVPDVLGDFLARHRQVNVRLAEAAGDEAVQALLEGAADIGFVTEQVALHGLQSFPYLDSGFALVVSRGHALAQEARGQPISLVRADACAIVGLLEGSALQDTWDRRAAARGVRLNYRVRVPGFDAQVRLVERGVGVAMLPEATARRYARTMALEVLPVTEPHLRRRLRVCVRQLDALGAPARQLVDALRAVGAAAAPPPA